MRGNGKVIQELEAAFRGAGWNVIKVIWGGDWDPLLARDTTGLLQKRMGEVVDGEFQTYVTKDGAYIRQHFFGKYPELLELVSHLSDEEVFKLRRGGHDPKKVYNAYQQALDTKGTAHADSGAHRQGLRPGRSRRRPQHFPPAEETQRGGDRALPLALRNSHSRRSGAQRFLLPAAFGQPGDELPARTAPPAGRVHAQPARYRPATSWRLPWST